VAEGFAVPVKPGNSGGGKGPQLVVVFVGGFIFGRWLTNADPAMLRILAQSERFKARYDAAKLDIPLVEVR
jgi:hypothetical protein